MSTYDDLLELLKKHVVFFEELTATEQAKLEAARIHDIPALEECMKKEQADTLTLRGFDKKRLKMQEELSLHDLSFSQIIPLLPEEYRHDYTQVFNHLKDAYTKYKTVSDCAKEMIEINLYRVGATLEELRTRTKTNSGDVYTPDGTVPKDKFTFKDLKV